MTATRKRTKRKCDRCQTVSREAVACGPVWDVGGNNIAHFEWSKDDSPLFLCEKCEEDDEEYRSCDDCGARVDVYHWGAGYLPANYDGDPLCPECGKKQFPHLS